MHEEEYKRWKHAMFRSLRYCYTHLEAKYIIDFWDRIKGKTEREMMGENGMAAIAVLDSIVFDNADTGIPWSVRNASQWACRCWIYAPLLAAEYHKTGKPRKGERHAENQK